MEGGAGGGMGHHPAVRTPSLPSLALNQDDMAQAATPKRSGQFWFFEFDFGRVSPGMNCPDKYEG